MNYPKLFLVAILAASLQLFLIGADISAQEKPAAPMQKLPAAFVVPNFHPASCGWLTNWSTERNYCANTYLEHLNRVRDDENYRFVLSECNNMIAIQNFTPARFAELKERVKEGRVELPNAFFLESTINLSGGEALVKMGVEGIRWQRQVMEANPRFGWIIDVCGTHEQMPQICAGLGLEGMIYTRCNRSGKTLFWSEAPDGSRIMTFVPGHYSDFGPVFRNREPMTQKEMGELEQNLIKKAAATPAGLPLLVLGGSGDYSLPPANPGNPTEFLKSWKETFPGNEVQFSTFSSYYDKARSTLNSENIPLPVVKGGTGYTFDSFWIENPRVKSWYRRDEHALQSAEIVTSIASLKTDFQYPAKTLYHGWLLMLLNMDRNTLWGSAGGMVFEHETSWDARDRFEWVETKTRALHDSAIHQLLGHGEATGLFNPANWQRNDPVRLKLTSGTSLAGFPCEALSDGTMIAQVTLPSTGLRGIRVLHQSPHEPKEIKLPETIETRYYSVQLDPVTGDITSLKVKPSGREMIGGPANVLVAEQRTGKGDPGDFTNPRPQRPKLASSSDFLPEIKIMEGPLSFTAEVRSKFHGGGSCTRLIRFYKNFRRIDFETELNDIPDQTVVVAEFPLSEMPLEIRRGIPFGFSHAPWSEPNGNLPGLPNGIQPSVRWSDYSFADGSGMAILDRGLSGREINEKTPVIYLLNATDKYYGYANSWLSGKGKHRLEYALIPHDEWSESRIPLMAWEYNCPVTVVPDCAVKPARSFVKTSANVIVEAIRREGDEIELRLAECLGMAGDATVAVNLPHSAAALTNLLGENPQPLTGKGRYTFRVRPQQIVTLRLKTQSRTEIVKPLLAWDELVPPSKQPALNRYQKDTKGHPPRGN